MWLFPGPRWNATAMPNRQEGLLRCPRSPAHWRALWTLAMVLASSERAAAGEVWSWHSIDVSVLKTSKAEVIVHARLRTGNSFGTLQQGRTGVIGKFPQRHRRPGGWIL